MVSITVEIPDWAEKRAIYVMAGVELLAYQYPGGPLLVKAGRCNECGDCCTIRGEPCEHLIPNGSERMVCGKGPGRPFSCCIGRGADRVAHCTERFEEA